MTDRPAGDVSRETPPAPGAAARLFPGERLGIAERYAGLLASDGVVRGLIGPREAPRLWDRHLLNCAVLAELLPRRARVADIGTGAGLPGVVLAIARPDLDLTLIEPLLRRTTFLDEAVDRLALDNVHVLRSRAEEQHGNGTFDVVTSRAVAPLPRLLQWCMPLVAPDGMLVAMKGSSAAEEVTSAEDALHSQGCGVPQIHVLGQDVLSSPTYAVEVRWADPDRPGQRAADPALGRRHQRDRRDRRDRR